MIWYAHFFALWKERVDYRLFLATWYISSIWGKSPFPIFRFVFVFRFLFRLWMTGLRTLKLQGNKMDFLQTTICEVSGNVSWTGKDDLEPGSVELHHLWIQVWRQQSKVVFMQSRETQITMVKWTNAGGQTTRANERSFVYRPTAWRRWRNVKTTYWSKFNLCLHVA